VGSQTQSHRQNTIPVFEINVMKQGYEVEALAKEYLQKLCAQAR
jgi:hypothetical protein